MYQFILFVHSLVAICLVLFILVQQGKGAVVGAAFGSGASQTLFGSRGSNSFLFRVTMGLMVVFFVSSIILNRLLATAFEAERVSSRYIPASFSHRRSVVPQHPGVLLPKSQRVLPKQATTSKKEIM